MERPKRKSAGNSTAVTPSTVTSNGCSSKVTTRINGLNKKVTTIAKQTNESTVTKHGDYMKINKLDESGCPKNMSQTIASPHMTRLAAKQAAIAEQNITGSEMRARRRENREQKKHQQQPKKATPKHVSCKGNKECQDEELGTIKVKEEYMETQESENIEQQEQQMLRTLSKDLVLSDTDDEVDPMATDSQDQNSGILSCQQQSSMESNGGEQHGVHSQSQVLKLEVSGSELHTSCAREYGQREKKTLRKFHCARCRRYNCVTTTQRRRHNLLTLWMLPEKRNSTLAPEVVERRDNGTSIACRTKSHCEYLLKNGYRMVIKADPETPVKQEVKTEPPEDSYVPYHLLSTEEQPEREGSRSPDVRNVTSSSDGDIIAEAMQAAMNGQCLVEDDEACLGGSHDEGCYLGNNTAGLADTSIDIKSHNADNAGSHGPDIGSHDPDTGSHEGCLVANNVVEQAGTSMEGKSCNAGSHAPDIGSHDPDIRPHDEGYLEKDIAVVQQIGTEMDIKSCDAGNAGSHDIESHDTESHGVGSHDRACLGGNNVVEQTQTSMDSKSCDADNAGSHDIESHDTESHGVGSHDRAHLGGNDVEQAQTSMDSKSRDADNAGSYDVGSHDQDNFKSLQQCPVTTAILTPTASSNGKRRRSGSSNSNKKSCVLDLRSVKAAPSTDDTKNKVIRTGKINLSTVKNQSITENDVSLKRIIQQKSMSLNLVKLPADQLPARSLWPSPKSQSTSITATMPRGSNNNFTFNLDKVVSRAAKEFSFTALATKPAEDSTVNRNNPSVFQRLGEQQGSFRAPIEPETPSSDPPQDEDFLEVHAVDSFLDEIMDDNMPVRTPKKQPPPSSQQQATTTANTVTAAKPSVQKCVQFDNRIPPHQSKHIEICQWVNHTRINPPPPPPGYRTSSDGSGPALFSFPSSPVPTPTTTPPNLDEDIDSLSVQLNVPKETNAAMEDARKLISDGHSWNRRESLNSNGLTRGGAPKGLCFKYWNSGICVHSKTCKFPHVRNPAVDKWWNSEGFLGEMELLITHSVETAWFYLKTRPPPSIPPPLLQAVIVACTSRPSILSINHPNYIQIAEEAFTQLLSQPRCPREYFFTMLKCYAAHHCNSQAFWLVQEMSKYGYLLSKDMAICLIGCYQPLVTHLLDLIMWIENAGLFHNMYNRIAQCVTVETPLQELCALLEVCARHRVKLHYGNTTSLVNICVTHNNCEAVIRVLEVSHDPSIITAQHLEFILMTHTAEDLDRVTNIVVTLFPHDLCRKISSVAWNKLLCECCSQQRSAKAMQIFHYMSNASILIDKEVYVSLMTLHCDQRHPSEVLTVLEHQIRCHADTSSVLMICQQLVKHQYWGVVCDLIICLIHTGNRPDESMVQDIKNALLQNNEVQRWKSLVEKAESMGVDLDHPVGIPEMLGPLGPPAQLPSHPDTSVTPQEQLPVNQEPPVKKNVSFCLDTMDNILVPPADVAPPPIAVPSPIIAPPPIAAPPSIAAPPLVITPPSSQPPTITPMSLQRDEFSFLLPNEMLKEHSIAPPSALQPQPSASTVLSLEDGGVYTMVKKSIVDGQWLSLGAIVQLLPINLQLVQVMAATIQSQPNIPSAMTSMITSFKKFHQIENTGQSLSGDLTSHERDLVGQVGVSMIMNAVAMEKWQDGFHVLYALHHHGIHYVTDQGGWSPCVIAMAAVECCLRLDIPQSALEVMRGAQWVNSNNPVERNRRNIILEKLVRACVTKKEIVGAEETLKAMESTVSVTTHNELFQLVLMAAKQVGNTEVYSRMSKKNQLPSISNKPVTLFAVEPANNSAMNLFSADKMVYFGPQVATSPAITPLLPSTVSLTSKGTPPSEATRQMRTEFRQKVTKACSQHLKQYFKEKRISKDDYVHLGKLLSKKYYHQVEASSSGPWELTESLSQEIHRTIENVFSQCTVYTKDLDSKLNLVESQ